MRRTLPAALLAGFLGVASLGAAVAPAAPGPPGPGLLAAAEPTDHPGPDDARRRAWADLFAGATPAAGADAAAHLRALVGSRPFAGREPAPDLLVDGGEGTRVLRDGADGWLMALAPHGRGFALDTTALPGTDLRAWWFDPRTGTPVDAGSVQRGPSTVFYPPVTGPADAGEDWVLVVDDAARGFAPPGGA